MPDVANSVLRGTELGGALCVNGEPLASIDFNQNPVSSIFRSSLAKVGGNMVEVPSWYDNEWGFSNRMLGTTVAMMIARAWWPCATCHCTSSRCSPGKTSTCRHWHLWQNGISLMAQPIDNFGNLYKLRTDDDHIDLRSDDSTTQSKTASKIGAAAASPIVS